MLLFFKKIGKKKATDTKFELSLYWLCRITTIILQSFFKDKSYGYGVLY